MFWCLISSFTHDSCRCCSASSSAALFTALRATQTRDMSVITSIRSGWWCKSYRAELWWWWRRALNVLRLVSRSTCCDHFTRSRVELNYTDKTHQRTHDPHLPRRALHSGVITGCERTESNLSPATGFYCARFHWFGENAQQPIVTGASVISQSKTERQPNHRTATLLWATPQYFNDYQELDATIHLLPEFVASFKASPCKHRSPHIMYNNHLHVCVVSVMIFV